MLHEWVVWFFIYKIRSGKFYMENNIFWGRASHFYLNLLIDFEFDTYGHFMGFNPLVKKESDPKMVSFLFVEFINIPNDSIRLVEKQI